MKTYHRRVLNLCLILSAFGLGTALRAGDAVYVDYDSSPQQLGCTFSSTPRGGLDYLSAAEACEHALAVAQSRGCKNPTILASSDLTGYFCVVAGATDSGRRVYNVGYGATQAEAEKQAFAGLRKLGGIQMPKVMDRYFSYGSDSAKSPSTN
jgi:hypothetical protein